MKPFARSDGAWISAITLRIWGVSYAEGQRRFTTVIFGLLVALVVIALPSSGQADVIVNSTADPGDGICDVTECTLREAISAANTNPGTDSIEFDIPGVGPHTIQPTSALPTITSPVTIDGTTPTGLYGYTDHRA